MLHVEKNLYDQSRQKPSVPSIHSSPLPCSEAVL